MSHDLRMPLIRVCIYYYMLFVFAFFAVIPVQAIGLLVGTPEVSATQSQFRFLPVEEKDLIPVRVLGAVARPGIHYVPRKTSLIDLLTLSGGAGSNAKLDRVTITKNARLNATSTVIQYNAEGALDGSSDVQAPLMESDDVVYIPTKQPWIDSDVTAIVGLATSVTSLILSFLILRREI